MMLQTKNQKNPTKTSTNHKPKKLYNKDYYLSNKDSTISAMRRHSVGSAYTLYSQQKTSGESRPVHTVRKINVFRSPSKFTSIMLSSPSKYSSTNVSPFLRPSPSHKVLQQLKKIRKENFCRTAKRIQSAVKLY